MKNLVLNGIQSRLTAQAEKYRELKNQRGMTLLEIIIVLGIIGIIAAGVVVLAQRAFDAKAMTDLTNNTNILRTAMKDAYGPTGSYPMITNGAATTALGTAQQLADGNIPLSQLVKLGKITAEEARNPISGIFLHVGGASIQGNAGAGYFIEIGGLNQRQCRNFILQTGNQWDYLQIVNGPAATTGGGGAGAYVSTGTPADGATVAAGGPDLTATTAAPGATPANPIVVRSMAANGSVQITPQLVTQLCEDSSSNNIILGSR